MGTFSTMDRLPTRSVGGVPVSAPVAASKLIQLGSGLPSGMAANTLELAGRQPGIGIWVRLMPSALTLARSIKLPPAMVVCAAVPDLTELPPAASIAVFANVLLASSVRARSPCLGWSLASAFLKAGTSFFSSAIAAGSDAAPSAAASPAFAPLTVSVGTAASVLAAAFASAASFLSADDSAAAPAGADAKDRAGAHLQSCRWCPPEWRKFSVRTGWGKRYPACHGGQPMLWIIAERLVAFEPHAALAQTPFAALVVHHGMRVMVKKFEGLK